MIAARSADKMATTDQSYQFRRMEADLTFEKIIKFREAFREHYRPITAKQVLEALVDKPDIRPPLVFSVAKGPFGSLFSVCGHKQQGKGKGAGL